MPRSKAPLPDELLALRSRLAQFRDTHPPGSPLPEELWQEAARFGAQHGVHRTARALPVDYARLNQRVTGRKPAPAVRRTPPPLSPAAVDFVDLMLSHAQQQHPVVVVELLGSKRTVHWIGPSCSPPGGNSQNHRQAHQAHPAEAYNMVPGRNPQNC